MAGWIKIDRALREHDIWKKEKFTRGQAWMDMLLMAAYKDTYSRINGHRIDLKAGQLCWSKRNLACRWSWSRNRVNRFFVELQTDHMIEPRNVGITTVVTILNWSSYQHNDTTNDTSRGAPGGLPGGLPGDTSRGAPDDTRRKNIQEIKNLKEEPRRLKSENLHPDFSQKEPQKGPLSESDPIFFWSGKRKIFKPADSTERSERLAEWTSVLEQFGAEACDKAYLRLEASTETQWVAPNSLASQIASMEVETIENEKWAERQKERESWEDKKQKEREQENKQRRINQARGDKMRRDKKIADAEARKKEIEDMAARKMILTELMAVTEQSKRNEHSPIANEDLF